MFFKFQVKERRISVSRRSVDVLDVSGKLVEIFGSCLVCVGGPH